VTDLEKTPILYWPILAGWRLFGVNEYWPRIVAYIIASINLVLTYGLTRIIFPKNKSIGLIAIIILLCNLYWPEFSGQIRWDGLVILFGLCSLICYAYYLKFTAHFYWLILSGLSFGLSIFSKGMVSFIYYFPLIIFFPILLGLDFNKKAFFALPIFFVTSLIIPLLWLVFIYYDLGYLALHYIMFGQVTNRIALHFEMTLWTTLLVNFSLAVFFIKFSKPNFDKKSIVLIAQIAFVLLFFSAVVVRQSNRYLIPVYPIIAILIANYFTTRNLTRLTGFCTVFCLGISIHFISLYFSHKEQYQKNLIALSKKMYQLQSQGYDIVQFGHLCGYQNLNFFGSLPKDIDVLFFPDDQKKWLATHKRGVYIFDSHLGYQIGHNRYLNLQFNEEKAPIFRISPPSDETVDRAAAG
jgi:4-amino-4-deoxy-L-arabinose transferase-like glycosyltransferase